MKKAILLLLLTITLAASGQTPVYFDFVTHNEETNQWNGAPYYLSNRNKLITLANYFNQRGITWNMQSDWVYLSNVISQETSTMMAQTNNKNILRWMYEDKGVEMDPHAHESKYIYPDVAKLMDSIGLPESKVIGGTLYSDSNGINIWTKLVNGQYGVKFPSHFWKPQYMMGGGTPNHVADIKYYGMWNPQSPTSYLTHDTSVHLVHMGVGCSIKIQDTTSVAYVMSQIHELLNNVASGKYPSNGWYFQTIFFEQGELNNTFFYNKVTQVADSVNALVTAGKAQWKTFKQAYTIWETTYSKKMFQWDCGQIASGSIEETHEDEHHFYPNPANSKVFINLGNSFTGLAKLSIYDHTGKTVLESHLTQQSTEVDVSALKPGIYFFQVNTAEGLIVEKILIQ